MNIEQIINLGKHALKNRFSVEYDTGAVDSEWKSNLNLLSTRTLKVDIDKNQKTAMVTCIVDDSFSILDIIDKLIQMEDTKIKISFWGEQGSNIGKDAIVLYPKIMHKSFIPFDSKKLELSSDTDECLKIYIGMTFSI